MRRFKSFITELAKANVKKEPGKTKVSVVLGRFQPPTLGHKKIFTKMKGKIVIAVVNTGTPSAKSPLKFDLQKKMLKKIAPSAEVIQVKTGFIGEFIDPLRKKGMEPNIIYAGSDRVNTYKGQVSRYEDELNLNIKVNETVRTGEAISATQVRNAIKKDDEATFKKLTDKSTHSFYKQLKKFIK